MSDGITIESIAKAVELLEANDVAEPETFYLVLRRCQLPMFGYSHLSDEELKKRGIHIAADEDIYYG
jgi:hypothetical protein